MEDSEKRSRGVFARRQQQQPMTPPRVIIEPDSPRKNRRKVSDFMSGVAAALNARKNNLMGQTPTSIPRHIDISYRDKKDVTAKRRFQVKVPFRLMAILGLVFLLIPFMVFLHKEMHIHEEQYVSHYKSESYANVNTKDVWDKFKKATTTDDGVQEGVKINTTISEQQIQLDQDNSSEQHNRNGTISDAHENEAAQGEAQVHEDAPQDAGSAPLEQGNQNDLSSENAAPIPLDKAEFVEGSNNDKNEINDGNVEPIGTVVVDTTASKNIPDR